MPFPGHTPTWKQWHGVLDKNEKGQPLVESFSGIGALFARYLTDHLNEAALGKETAEAPTFGLIQAAFGGSSVEAWTKTEQGN